MGKYVAALVAVGSIAFAGQAMAVPMPATITKDFLLTGTSFMRSAGLNRPSPFSSLQFRIKYSFLEGTTTLVGTPEVQLLSDTGAPVAISGLFGPPAWSGAATTESWAFFAGIASVSTALNDSNKIDYHFRLAYPFDSPVASQLQFSNQTGTSWGTNGAGLKLTPYVASSSAAPEPASWAMMIAGFGLTGAAMRRRKMSIRFA